MLIESSHCYATTLLYCSVNAPKWLPVNCEHDFPNIGAFRIDNGKDSPYIDDLFRILTIPWRYVPDSKDMDVCVALFSQHYRKDQVELFQRTCAWQCANNPTIRRRKIFVKGIFRSARKRFQRVSKFVASFFRQKQYTKFLAENIQIRSSRKNHYSKTYRSFGFLAALTSSTRPIGVVTGAACALSGFAIESARTLR